MGGSGKGNATSNMPNCVLNVLLKICFTMFLSNVALHAGAIRTGQLSSEGNVVNSLAFPDDLIAENPDRLSEQGENRTNSGKAANDSDLALFPHANSTLDAGVKDGFECRFQFDFLSSQKGSYIPDGLPIFRVTFTNTCLDCAFIDVHVACGDFTSGNLVNPAIFKRLAYDDCLLNSGKPVAPQDTVAFEYISTFAYPMTVDRASTSCGLS